MAFNMSDLVLIPVRGGSKGIPGKNVKLLGGKPIIYYTLEAAREVSPLKTICVSTDSDEIIKIVREYGFDLQFKRPANLATETASTYEVVLHALNFFKNIDQHIEKVILLQPTSPFRTAHHITEALALYHPKLYMVVSVKKTKSNPYFNLFEENGSGFLVQSKKGNFSRRQDCPPVYEYNGAIYIMNAKSLKKKQPSQFERIKKYIMSEEDSLDIDTPLDLFIAQTLIEKRKIKNDE